MDLSILAIILIGAIPSVLKKKLLNDLDLSEYFISFTICMSFLTFCLFCYKTYIKKEKIQLNKVFNSSVFPLFITLVLLKFVSIYKKLGFLKNMQVSTYAPIFKSLSILFTIILGIVFLGEKKTMKELVGATFVVIGVLLLNGMSTKGSGSS